MESVRLQKRNRNADSKGVIIKNEEEGHGIEDRFRNTSASPFSFSSSVHSFVGRGLYTSTSLEIVRDDPTNNIPDTIFAKLGMQLPRTNQHPLGILKNAIYDYFDTNYPDKFDDLCPIVSVRQNFDEVLVPADHVSRSYNDTYYVDSQTVLRCHTSANQAELLRNGHTHFFVTVCVP